MFVVVVVSKDLLFNTFFLFILFQRRSVLCLDQINGFCDFNLNSCGRGHDFRNASVERKEGWEPLI